MEMMRSKLFVVVVVDVVVIIIGEITEWSCVLFFLLLLLLFIVLLKPSSTGKDDDNDEDTIIVRALRLLFLLSLFIFLAVFLRTSLLNVSIFLLLEEVNDVEFFDVVVLVFLLALVV